MEDLKKGIVFAAAEELTLDALQISVGLQSLLGICLPDSKAFHRHSSTINDMADCLQPE